MKLSCLQIKCSPSPRPSPAGRGRIFLRVRAVRSRWAPRSPSWSNKQNADTDAMASEFSGDASSCSLSMVAADVRRTPRRNAGRRGPDVGGARTILRPQRVRTAEGSERIRRPFDSRRAAAAERQRSGVMDRRSALRITRSRLLTSAATVLGFKARTWVGRNHSRRERVRASHFPTTRRPLPCVLHRPK